MSPTQTDRPTEQESVAEIIRRLQVSADLVYSGTDKGLAELSGRDCAFLIAEFQRLRNIEGDFELSRFPPEPSGDAAVYEELRDLLLDQPWHAKVEIIPNYMPPHPRDDTRPTLVIRYNDGTEYAPFLRHSHGPKQGFFWDIYGDHFQTEALAILALSKAPAPVSVAPHVFRVTPTKGDNDRG